MSNTEFRNFLEGPKRKIVKEMWPFLNRKFGLTYPFPNISIYTVQAALWKTYTSSSLVRTIQMNEMEERRVHGDISSADAQVLYDIVIDWGESEESTEEDKFISFISFLETECERCDFVILVADNSCHIEGNFCRTTSLPHMGFNYYYLLVLHELIHILERLSNRQLLTKGGDDLILANEFFHWNYEIIKRTKVEEHD